MFLTEDHFDSVEPIIEQAEEGKKTYLTGVMSVAEEKNRNGRIYSKDDLKKVEAQINDAAKMNRHILGEISHPSTLEINLENVVHRLVEARMEGNKLMFKAEILEKHPKGAIVKSLLDSGVQIGVSTRGSGQVNENTGAVSNYRFVTLDCVSVPSCPHSYPTTIQEQLEMYGRGEIITDLSENLAHDPIAQAYFQLEMKRFIESLYT